MEEELEEFSLKSKLNFSIWKRVFKDMLDYPWLVFIGILAMVGVAFGETMVIKYLCTDGLKKFLDTGIDKNFYIFVVEMALLIIVVGLCTSIFIMACGTLERKFYKALTSKTFNKLQEQPFSFFDRSNVGWLMARVSSDTSRLGEIISWGLIDIVYAIFKLLFIFIVTLTINPVLSLILLIIIPVVTIVASLFGNKIIKLSRSQRKINAMITTKLNEGITGAKTSKTLNIEAKNINEFKNTVNEYQDITVKISFYQTSFYQVIAISSAFALALMGYFGGMSSLDASTFFLFLSYCTSFFEPVMTIANLTNQLKHAQVAAERVYSLNDIKPAILDTPEVIEKYGTVFEPKKENYEKLNGNIKFDHVYFQYNENKKVLFDFNLDVKEGETIALVGETGAGKSTIINLLSRFYEPTSGKILIDGKDYKERSVGWLHSNLGYVLQSPQLFSGTIYDNVRYGKLDASNEEIIEACKLVQAHDFIIKLEKRYDTEVGEGGNRLSLGQKQLISFARAIIANPRLLIFDEATSSVDSETEYIIQNAIASILKGRTCFIVAHRLSTIVNATKILVINGGKVIESGSHEELMKNKGYYYKLYTNQFIEEKMKELNF